jgi:hypothetical protein
MTPLDELPYRVWRYGLGAEELTVALLQRLAVAWLNDGQGENGYRVLDLDGPLRWLTEGEPRPYQPMYSLPQLSPDERLLVCAPGDTCFAGRGDRAPTRGGPAGRLGPGRSRRRAVGLRAGRARRARADAGPALAARHHPRGAAAAGAPGGPAAHTGSVHPAVDGPLL